MYVVVSCNCVLCVYLFPWVVVVLWLLVWFLRFMCMLFYINLRPLRFPLRPCLATIAAIAGSLEHPLGAGIAGQGPAGATRSNPCWRCYRPHAVGALVGAEGVVLAHLVEEMV